jgi:hypothetical protein
MMGGAKLRSFSVPDSAAHVPPAWTRFSFMLHQDHLYNHRSFRHRHYSLRFSPLHHQQSVLHYLARGQCSKGVLCSVSLVMD